MPNKAKIARVKKNINREEKCPWLKMEEVLLPRLATPQQIPLPSYPPPEPLCYPPPPPPDMPFTPADHAPGHLLASRHDSHIPQSLLYSPGRDIAIIRSFSPTPPPVMALEEDQQQQQRGKSILANPNLHTRHSPKQVPKQQQQVCTDEPLNLNIDDVTPLWMTKPKFGPRKRRFQNPLIRRSQSPMLKKQRRDDVAPLSDQVHRFSIRARGKTIGVAGKEPFGARRVTFVTTINPNENEYGEEEMGEEATNRPTKKEAKKVGEGASFGCELGQEEQEQRTCKIGDNENVDIHSDNGPKMSSDAPDIIILYSTTTTSKNGEKVKKIEAAAKDCVYRKEMGEQRKSKIVINEKHSPMNSSTESSDKACSSSSTMEDRVDEMLIFIGNGCEVSSSEMLNLLLDMKEELRCRTGK